VVLDEFLTISRVAALKYGGPGGAVLRAGGRVLEPVPDASRNDVVEFSAGGAPAGRLLIDWDRRMADVVPEDSEAIRRFAASELGLAPR
jgi:hypothetical protein